MPDIGRFFNIDPLSEKYAYQSHYNFSENRVVDGVELEGLEWENFRSKFKSHSELKVKSPSSSAEKQSYSVSVTGNTKTLNDFYSSFKNSPQDLLSNSKATFNQPIDANGNATTTNLGAYIGIDIEGPLNNGFVKVTGADKSDSGFSFTFATLEGHLESGVITFGVTQTENGLTFNINSKSDISNGTAGLFLSEFTRSKQISSWQEVLNNFVDMSGGTKIDSSTKREQTEKSNFFKSYIDKTFEDLNNAINNISK